jgi:hypothetical protein
MLSSWSRPQHQRKKENGFKPWAGSCECANCPAGVELIPEPFSCKSNPRPQRLGLNARKHSEIHVDVSHARQPLIRRPTGSGRLEQYIWKRSLMELGSLLHSSYEAESFWAGFWSGSKNARPHKRNSPHCTLPRHGRGRDLRLPIGFPSRRRARFFNMSATEPWFLRGGLVSVLLPSRLNRRRKLKHSKNLYKIKGRFQNVRHVPRDILTFIAMSSNLCF